MFEYDQLSLSDITESDKFNNSANCSLYTSSQSSFTFIDLFAGIGGMRLGFESIGGRCVFTMPAKVHCWGAKHEL